MPKKSLVINGFLGGINEDADLTDIQSEDQGGKNELTACDDGICNMPGKIRGKTVVSAAGEGALGLSGTADASEDLLIYGTDYYRNQGVYKVGSNVEWSGKNTVKRPNSTALATGSSNVSQQTSSLGLKASGTSTGEDLDYVFLGKAATQSNGDCLIANSTAALTQKTDRLIAWNYDEYNDGKIPNPPFGTEFTSHKHFGFISDTGWTVSFWDESASANSWGGHTASPANGSFIGAYPDTGSQSYAECDYIRLGRRYINDSSWSNYDPAIVIRTGNGPTNNPTDNIPGLYDTGINVADKDIYIEISINGNNSGNNDAHEWAEQGTSGFTRLTIVLDSHFADSIVNYNPDLVGDSYCKIYRKTRAELDSLQAIDRSNGIGHANIAKARIKIPYDSAIFTGDNFNGANIANIWIIAEGADMSITDNTITGGTTRWLLNLYELSFMGSTQPGWANTNTKFIQTKVTNGIESLLRPYDGYLSLVSDNTMNLEIAKPSDAHIGKLYYQEADDNGVASGSLFLLAEVDTSKGVKSILSTYYRDWDDNGTDPDSVKLVMSDPPISSTYKLEAGYPTDTESINAQWDHAVAIGRQVYIGSVVKEGEDLASTAVSVNAGTTPDLYPTFSTVGYSLDTATYPYPQSIHVDVTSAADPSIFQYSFDGGTSWDVATITMNESLQELGSSEIYVKFPVDTGYTVGDEWKIVIEKETDLILKGTIGKKYGFPDLNYIDLELPGSGITAMMASGDRLFVFSDDMLNIVNVAQDFEFLEGSFQGYGVTNKKSVCKVLEGLAFVNNTGVYYFDGAEMNSLSDDLMMSRAWTNGSSIGYLPSEKIVVVWDSAKLWGYSLVTKAWVTKSIAANAIPSTAIAYYGNEAHFLTASAMNKLALSSSTLDPSIETGKIICGDPSRRKKFKKVYISSDFDAGTLTLEWSIDGAAYNTPQGITTGDNFAVTINANGKNIRFKLVGSGLSDDYSIGEISLIYRDKTVK